ncbi:MAG: putative glucokinase, family [Bacillales bacterium]|jgi:glucokinase|nr:putative glucokinase, family [Bacillales bacterium]
MTKNWLIGVDLGGTFVKLAFFNYEGTLQHKWEVPTDHSDNGMNIVKGIAKAIDEKITELGMSKSDFLGVGMGAPGPFKKDGTCIIAVNLGWKDYPLKDELSNAVGLPAVVDNDANIAAYGEFFKGAGRGTQDFVMVTLGTGVGGGVITNGQIVQGCNGAGGELGHMTIVLEGGPKCGCGKYGCLEALVSATGITRMGEFFAKENPRSRMNDSENLSSKEIYKLAAEGDLAAKDVVDRVGYYLGAGLANIGNMLNPEIIAVGGGVSKAGDAVLNPAIEYFNKLTFSAVKSSTKIVLAELGNDAGVYGAAGLIKDSFPVK